MELRRLWRLVWHRKFLVVAVIVAALFAGYGITPRQSLYRASTTLFVGAAENTSGGVFSNDLLLGSEQLAITFASMVPTLSLAQVAVQSTGIARTPQKVVDETTSSVVASTSLIKVNVTDTDPVVAQRLANGIGNAFVAQMLRLDPITSIVTGQTASPFSPVSISQAASLPRAPLASGLKRNLILSGLFGLLFAVALILVLDYLDLSVRTPEDLEKRAGLPVLGIIPLYPELPSYDRGLPGSVVTPADTVSGKP